MADRLGPSDVSFLYVEDATTPMHTGTVSVFAAPEGGFDHNRLVRLIRERIAFVPRYRQRVRWVPGRLANPVWVDDEHFDVTYHVRRSALPRPGTDDQLEDLVARIMSRPLDRNRPLWEVYLVEGLSDGRFAVLTKSHNAMVDGLTGVDIGQVILDVTPEPRHAATDTWRPGREPSSVELVTGAVVDAARRPVVVVDAARAGLGNLSQTIATMGRHAAGLVAAALTATRQPPESPLTVEIGEQRRFTTASIPLDDLKRVRAAHGGTINDVLLAVVAGGLRAWLATRRQAVDGRREIRAMVPISVAPDHEPGAGSRVTALVVDLPVGEADPIVRLQRISYEMSQYKDSGRLMGASAILGLSGFAPPTLHALGARAGSSISRRAASLVITNVPGPQFPLYAGGARMLATYPVVPLSKHQALSVGITSYDGRVFIGLNGDRDAMSDLDVLAGCLEDALVELRETTTPAGRRRSVRSLAGQPSVLARATREAPATGEWSP